jgi:RPA family protein
MEQQKRQVAKKIRISELINGRYVKEEGWTPNYVVTDYGNISRANVLAFVVSKNEDGSLIIDDGSANISVRSFEEKKYDVNIGDLILVVGRPREWNNTKYLVPEIVRKVENRKWIGLRKLELKGLSKVEKEKIMPETVEEEMVVESPYQKMINIIRGKDTGNGAEYQDVLINSNIRDAERILNTLLEEGEIFEIRPGRLKVLE